MVHGRAVRSFSPGFGILDFSQGLKRPIHGGDVLVDDFFTLLAVGLPDGVLDVGDGVVQRKHIGKLEESRLGNHVDAVPQAYLCSHFHRVYIKKLEMLARDDALHLAGQFPLHVLHGVPVGVQQEGAAFLDAPSSTS